MAPETTTHAEILNHDQTLRDGNRADLLGHWRRRFDVARRLCDERGGLELLAAALVVPDAAKGYLREIRRKNGGVVLIHCIQPQSAAALIAAIVPALQEKDIRLSASIRCQPIGPSRHWRRRLTWHAPTHLCQKATDPRQHIRIRLFPQGQHPVGDILHASACLALPVAVQTQPGLANQKPAPK